MNTRSLKQSQTTSIPPSAGGFALSQRKCARGQHTTAIEECFAGSQERESALQRSSMSGECVSRVPPIVRDVLRSPGQALESNTRALMEPRFGHDFSKVRVHSDAQAAESARSVNALAYTVGHDVVFGNGQYAPQSTEGQRLLAHELTHVAQLRSQPTAFQGRLTIGSADDASEREADQFAGKVMTSTGEAVGGLSSADGTMLRRKCPGSSEGGCSGGQWKYVYDGCTDPTGILGRLGIDGNNPAGGGDTQFAKCLPSDEGGRACDRHDECYQTCHHGEVGARTKCDLQMLADMIDTCLDSDGEEQRKCMRWAGDYYDLARNFGWLPYLIDQIKVCRCERKSQRQEAQSSKSKESPQEGFQDDGTTPETAADKESSTGTTEGTESATEQTLAPCKPTFKSLEAVPTGNIVMRIGDKGCELSFGTPGNEGMTFLSEVEFPDGCYGTLEYVQLVDFRRERRDEHSKTWCMQGTGALDTRDPKATKFTSPGSVSFESTDNPGSVVGEDVYNFAEDQFKLWLLWRPDPPTPPGMLWAPVDAPKLPRVAVATVSWDWSAKTNRTGNSGECQADWTISDDYAQGGTGAVTAETDIPAYSQNVADRVFSEGPC